MVASLIWRTPDAYTETLEGDGQEVGGLADLPSSRIAPAYRDLANDLGVEDFYEEARSTAAEAAAADEVRGRVASDFLESHRDNVLKKFDEIDAEFRDRLDGIEREASEVVQDTRAPAEPVDPKKLKGLPDEPPQAERDPGTTLGISLGGAPLTFQIGSD